MRLRFTIIIVCTLTALGLLVVFSCTNQTERQPLFADLSDLEQVTIVLHSYGIDSLPAEVGLLTNARELAVSPDSVKLNQWVVLPPQSAFDGRVDRPPFRSLPQEITHLHQLRKLALIALDIRELPEGFDKMQALEYLDLSFNKLTVANELDKLGRLTKLKKLVLVGNRVDTVALQPWHELHPAVELLY